MIQPIAQGHPVNCVEPCCVRFDDHPTSELVVQAGRERFMIFAFFHGEEVPEELRWKGAAIAEWWLQKHGVTPSNYLSVQMVMPPLTVERAKAEMRKHLASITDEFVPVGGPETAALDNLPSPSVAAERLK
jgi:hypothetical protein